VASGAAESPAAPEVEASPLDDVRQVEFPV